ncbi:MAG: type II toxin-antitoxin system PemK/MazF family toxin [Bacteroidetes bacterium]|nr:type II toxin-antitoxin system PemK/MazF family toxin [Bacteroidota bacterium]
MNYDKHPGEIVVFRFPQTDLEKGKLRPALLLARLPGEYDDWLTCMISSQVRHYVAGFDEIVQEKNADFKQSGLKVTSVIRLGRLAVISGESLIGAIGKISDERLDRIKKRLSKWLLGE